MSNTTKYALEASLKNLLAKKPFDKITIADLTEDCGISRMAFYYHFKDIYDKRALNDKKNHDNWQEGMLQVFEAVLENKPFIMNVYKNVNRERLENYLYRLTYQLIVEVVDEICGSDDLSEEDKKFIAGFYKYGFVGVLLDWIEGSMKGDYHLIVQRLALTLQGSLENSIHNFEEEKRLSES